MAIVSILELWMIPDSEKHVILFFFFFRFQSLKYAIGVYQKIN